MTTSTFDISLKERAPFTIRNSLGVPLIVQHSSNLRPTLSTAQGKLHELSVDQSMNLEHSVFELSSRGKLSALQRQESCLFTLTVGNESFPVGLFLIVTRVRQSVSESVSDPAVPTGYSEISNISVDKPGRRLYNIRSPMQQDAVSVLLQIDAAEGNKVITIRSPLQVRVTVH